ncbi:MAG: PAS domain S-box protein [Phyllobacterium sp.]|uniref:PAS domain S-box protein n=1 Tax=Phyllobacterium sp. TaxID=1871046 RepID=UPI0030EFE3CA
MSGTYPFIDIAVLDDIREHFANGDALVVVAPDLGSIIWANGRGAAMLGYGSIDDILGSDQVFDVRARRQLMALDGFPAIGHGRIVSLRVAYGLASRILTFQASDIALPGGERAILLTIADGERRGSDQQIAARAIKGFGDQATHAAMLDPTGKVMAASEHFGRLGLSDRVLGELVRDVRHERNRLVKRPVQTANGTVPTGIARLTDSPAQHLLFAVETSAGSIPEGNQPIEQRRSASPELSPEKDAGPGQNNSQPAALAFNQAAANTTRDARDQGPVDPDLVRPFRYASSEVPVRFVWKVDADARFSEISPELAKAVGPASAAIIGRSFRDVASDYGFAGSEEIASLLERRDTWSGRTVLWPIEGTELRAPIELAALPIYSRDRTFMGFRGFGVARMSDTVVDPNSTGLALGAKAAPANEILPETPDPSDAFGGEKPALATAADNVISLKTQRQPRDEGRLNDAERNAFREIAERLRREVLAPGQNDAADAPPSRPVDRASERDQPFAAADMVPDAELVGPGFAISSRGDDSVEVQSHPGAFAERIREQARKGIDTSILTALPLPVLIHRNGQILYANPALLATLGYDRAETINDAGGLGALFADLPEQGDDGDEAGTNLRHNDGSTLRMAAHLQAVRWDDDGERALLLALSPQPAAAAGGIEENEKLDLQTRIDELNAILDTATDGVVLLDAAGSIRSINHSAAALFGYEPEDVAGKPFSLLFAIESQRAAMDYLNSLSENGVASLLNDGREVIGRESQGRFIPLFMTIGKLDVSKGYCAVLRDITHWKRAEEELVSAKREAERTSSQKSEFLARISHEIRTPLNAIIGFSELMADEKFGPIGSERYRDYLNDISRSGNHVLSLVNDLLDISKIEAGAVEMDFEAVSLNDALTEAVAIMQPQANRERVIIRSSLTSRLPDIVADHRSITQIALNLLSNAIRFTGPGGQVIVSTSYEASGDVLLRVRDTGIGMTRQEVEQALRPYKQITTPRHARTDGTGLGLPLTKAMAEANRASFNIDSTPGRGTMVEITFPSTRVLAE